MHQVQITKRSKVYYPKHISHFGLIDEGDGVEQYDESAFEWFMKAAAKEDEDAQDMVGHFYEKGRGCEIDLVQALHWYQKSAAQGHQPAIDAVERLNHTFN